MELEQSTGRVAALLAPRNVVIVGASDRPGHWSGRVWRNLRRYGFPHPIYPVNPRRDTLWDVTCYPDYAALPEPPDHLVMLVQAALVPDLLRQGAEAGARSATVFTSGFGELGTAESRDLAQRLEQVIAETGIGVSGPNCMGNISAPARLVTMTEDRMMSLDPGPVALIGQSGGFMLFANRVLDERGIAASYVISTGNEAGLTTADYIAHFAGDPNIRAVVSYLEAVHDPEKFLAACRLARSTGTAVIMVKLGQSQEGRAAAMAHTGSLAGAIEVFDAVAGESGVIRVDSPDDVVETLEYVVHAEPPRGRGIAAITLSGAYRGLLLDAAARNGLAFADIAPETRGRLEELLSVGSIVGNPLDGGFGVLTSEDTYRACIRAFHDDPAVDMILLQEELPREAGMDRTERYLALVEDFVVREARKPIAFVSVFSHSQTDYSRELRARFPHLAFLQEAGKTMRLLARLIASREAEAGAEAGEQVPAPAGPAIDRCREVAAAAGTPQALNEVESKALLAAYGIAAPRETLARTAADAVAAAQAIGFPVVLKGVSAAVTHKTEAGAVVLGVDTPEAVRAAYQDIAARIAAHAAGAVLDGVLVCQQVTGGVELVVGLHRDPEMGPVVMGGRGGIWLELDRDVAFAPPPVSPASANRLIDRTRVSQIVAGYRGQAALDRDALVRALVALGRIAIDLGDVIESIDVNPFTLLPDGQGGYALDALVVVRGAGPMPG